MHGGAVAAVAVAGFAAALLAPRLFAGMLEGPEGTRWVGAAVAWVGGMATLWVSVYPLLHRRFGAHEPALAAGVILLFAGLILFVVSQRLTSGLRFLEPYNAAMIARAARFENLYADPSSHPAGTIYGPLLFILCAPAVRLGLSPAVAGRLVSLAGVIGTCACVYGCTRRMGGGVRRALWAVALFTATYGIAGKLYDTVAVDPLLMALLCCALYFFLGNTERDDLLALSASALACLTKQTAVLALSVVVVGVLVRRRRARTFFPLVLLVAAFGGTLLLSGGSAWDYLVRYPLNHPFRGLPGGGVPVRLLLLQFPLLVAALAEFSRRRHPRFLCFFVAVFISSLLGLVKAGGWINALFPFEPLLCVAAAPTMARRKILLVGQLVLGLFNPFAALYPWSTVRDVDRAAITLAQSVEGDVWFPAATHLYYRLDKQPWDHFAAVDNITWAGREPPGRLVNALSNRRFDLIILKTDAEKFLRAMHPALVQALDTNYTRLLRGRLVVYTPVYYDSLVPGDYA